MKKLLLAILLFSVVFIGCNAQTAAQDAQVAISVAVSIAAAEEPAIPAGDQAAFTSFVTLAQTLDTQLGTCITQVSGVMGKSGKFLACFNTFAGGLASPAEMAQLRLLSPSTQQKVQIYVTAAIAAVNIAIKAYGGASASTPTVATLTPDNQQELAQLEGQMEAVVQ